MTQGSNLADCKSPGAGSAVPGLLKIPAACLSSLRPQARVNKQYSLWLRDPILKCVSCFELAYTFDPGLHFFMRDRIFDSALSDEQMRELLERGEVFSFRQDTVHRASN